MNGPIYEDKGMSRLLALDINRLAHDIHVWAKVKGFWNVPEDVERMLHTLSDKSRDWIARMIKSQKLALVTTETSEQVEAVRKPDTESGLPGFSNEEEECADQIIRLLDYAARYDLRIGEAIMAKMAVNEGRPYKHNKEF
jgi:NTP pyrophosphatase (non-canonical NTP hydrolase)